MIHVYASQPSYWRHLDPIVVELRDRGREVTTWASRGGQPWGAQLRQAPRDGLAVVASWLDAQKLDQRPCVYVEHGAGQTYVDGESIRRGYAGSDRLGHVRLFLAPSERVAAHWRARYPQAAVEIVGCPALDQHFSRIRDTARDSDRTSTTSVTSRTVAFTSHWRCGVNAETMPALPLYESEIKKLETSFQLIGHAHPRNARRAAAMWDRLGIPFEVDPDCVLRNAQLLVADNTSLLFEAAAIDVPVLALNAPTYRRDVDHGLRFWSHVPGLQCDRPQDLQDFVIAALEDPPEASALRARAAAHVYAHRDDRASARAVDAIERVL